MPKALRLWASTLQMFSATTIRICFRQTAFVKPTRSLSSLACTRSLIHDVHTSRRFSQYQFRLSFLSRRHFFRSSPQLSENSPPPLPPKPDGTKKKIQDTIRENIYTLPNFLTVSRILACPVLGWSIVHDDFTLAISLLVYAGLTDLVSVLCWR